MIITYIAYFLDVITYSDGVVHHEEMKSLSNGGTKTDKDMVLKKLSINTRRIKKIIEEM